MATPMTSGAFGDLLDVRFKEIFYTNLEEPNDMIPLLYKDVGSNGRNDIRWSAINQSRAIQEFTGTVNYGSRSLGYDVTMVPVEVAGGIQIERKLFDDDQFNIMDGRPADLADDLRRFRQADAARIFTNAFGVDSYFYNHTEGVPLCSASHTTTSGASTAAGFNNLSFAALSATAVAAAHIKFKRLRGDTAERLDLIGDEIWHPPELYEQAFEIVKSMGKVDTANNNKNVHQGAYTLYNWAYLGDATDWFMCSGSERKKNLFWSDRIAAEFAMVEDFDTLVAKWRAYCRYGLAYKSWRWVIGSQVA